MSNEAPREIAVRSVERAISILDLLAVGGWRTGADIGRERQLAWTADAGPLHRQRQGDPRLRSRGGPRAAAWHDSGAGDPADHHVPSGARSPARSCARIRRGPYARRA